MVISEEMKNWASEIQKKLIAKMEPVVKRNADIIPYTAKDGRFVNQAASDICWWTNGFWGGILWQMYHLTNAAFYREAAETVERQLDPVLMNAHGLDHDNGFKWLPTAVIHYKLYGSADSLNRGMLAAVALAGRYNPVGKFIRAWNDNPPTDNRGRAIIDCMMNLPLLYWAYEESKDPRFLQIAVSHADTALEKFVRPDGSVNHIVEFDPFSGQVVKTYGGQGMFDGSSWTRGQSWGVYGFLISYKHTGDKRYLEAARQIADYFMDNIPEDGVIPVDFCQMADVDYEDGTAAAIAACGFLEIANTIGSEEGKKYADAAWKLLKALDERNCDWNPETDPLLTRCSAAYHDSEHNFPIIYGDYYFIEAVGKINNQVLCIW